jgi:hypothetical protein
MVLSKGPRVDAHMPQLSLDEQLPAAHDVDVRRDRARPKAADRGTELELIVEASGGAELQVGLRNDRVEPTGDHLLPRSDAGNDRVVKLSPGGTVILAWGSRGAGEGRFHSPTGIATDAAGNVYVVDRDNNRVQVFDSDGHFLAKWGVRGAGLGAFSQPTAVAVGCDGSVYVADTNNNRVQRFDPVAAAGTGCLAPGAWPPPLDVSPVLHLTLQRRVSVLGRRALALSVSCQRGCKILAAATLAPLGGRRSVPLVAAARSLPAALTTHVRLRVGPSALRRLRRALGRRRVLVARVNIVAAGPTGRRSSVTTSYLVTR